MQRARNNDFFFPVRHEIPEHLRPYELCFVMDLNTETNENLPSPEEQFVIWHTKARNLAEYVKTLTRVAREEDDTCSPLVLNGATAITQHVEFLKSLFSEWSKHLSTNKAISEEVRSLKNKQRYSFALLVVPELAKLYQLIYRDTHMMDIYNETGELYQSLKDYKHTLWIRIFVSYSTKKDVPENLRDDVLDALENEIQERLWTTPLYKCSQRQLGHMLMILTQMINDLHDPIIIDEFKSVVHACFLRYGDLERELHPSSVIDGLNVKDRVEIIPGFYSMSRAYKIMMSNYFMELLRRLFYYDLFYDRERRIVATQGGAGPLDITVPPEAGQRVKEFILNAIKRQLLPGETLFQIYLEYTLPEAFTFPGDLVWFQTEWPEAVVETAAILANLRPHLRNHFSQEQINGANVVERASDSYASRLFVLRCFDALVTMDFKRFTWYDTIVINNNGIEMAAPLFEECEAPYIVQVFSSFWLYYENEYYACDNIFEVIAAWLIVLRDKYDGIYYRQEHGSEGGNMNTFIYQALNFVDLQSQAEDKLANIKNPIEKQEILEDMMFQDAVRNSATTSENNMFV
mgnify:FL=1